MDLTAVISILSHGEALSPEEAEAVVSTIDKTLRDEEADIDWDDAWDTLHLLRPIHRAAIGPLCRIVRERAKSRARDFWFSYPFRSLGLYACFWAIRAISKIDPDSPEGVSVLQDVLYDRDSELRYRAVKALRKQSSDRAVWGPFMPNALYADTIKRMRRHIANLGSPDQATAQNAKMRLIRFGSKAVGILIEATANPAPQVRYLAVWALGKIRDPSALPTILYLTNDPDAGVAYDAVMALGELGDDRAIPYLQELAAGADDERCLVSASRQALAKLGHPIPEELW